MVGEKSGTKQGSSKEFLRASERGCSCCRWCSVDPVDYASPGRTALRFLLYRARGTALSGGKRADTSMSSLSRARNRLPAATSTGRGRNSPVGRGKRRRKNNKQNIVFPTLAVSWQDELISCCVFSSF